MIALCDAAGGRVRVSASPRAILDAAVTRMALSERFARAASLSGGRRGGLVGSPASKKKSLKAADSTRPTPPARRRPRRRSPSRHRKSAPELRLPSSGTRLWAPRAGCRRRGFTGPKPGPREGSAPARKNAEPTKPQVEIFDAHGGRPGGRGPRSAGGGGDSEAASDAGGLRVRSSGGRSSSSPPASVDASPSAGMDDAETPGAR